jgi:hypothetical protein
LQFRPEEIGMARELRRLGLPWEPKAGHYVYDETGFCRKASPFQDGVYFVLNYEYFMRQAGGVERFKEIMLWLPTWHDVREILETFGVSNKDVAATLRDRGAIERHQELSVLYEMIADRLRRGLAAADSIHQCSKHR